MSSRTIYEKASSTWPEYTYEDEQGFGESGESSAHKRPPLVQIGHWAFVTVQVCEDTAA